MKLHVHLHQRLVHVLDVGCGVVQQPFSMAQIRPQCCNPPRGMEAPAQQSVLVQLLEPLCVVDVGLATGNSLGVSRVDQHHFHSPSLKDLERRDPIHPGRFHCHRRNPHPLEPFGQAIEFVGERRERTHRFGIQIFGHRHHMELRTDIDPGGPWMNHGPLSLLTFRSCHHSLSCLVMSRRAGRRKASIS